MVIKLEEKDIREALVLFIQKKMGMGKIKEKDIKGIKMHRKSSNDEKIGSISVEI